MRSRRNRTKRPKETVGNRSRWSRMRKFKNTTHGKKFEKKHKRQMIKRSDISKELHRRKKNGIGDSVNWQHPADPTPLLYPGLPITGNNNKSKTDDTDNNGGSY